MSTNADGDIFIGDGRLNNYGTDGAVYTPPNGGIQVYGINNESRGWLAAVATDAEIDALSCPPEQNIEIGTSYDNRYHIYYLTTCQFQVNMGPFGTDARRMKSSSIACQH